MLIATSSLIVWYAVVWGMLRLIINVTQIIMLFYKMQCQRNKVQYGFQSGDWSPGDKALQAPEADDISYFIDTFQTI